MPTQPRLYTESALSPGKRLALGEEATNYLSRVLRLGLGGEARLFNARDGEWLARIDTVGSRQIEVCLTERLRAAPPPAEVSLTLLFAPVKKDQTDLIIEKATELGAATIRPVLTERTQTRTVRLDRFRKIAVEATEQTERLDLPEILEAAPLPRALADLPAGTALIFCDETTGPLPGGKAVSPAPIRDILAQLGRRPAAILTGPEGGFTAFERAALHGRSDTYPVSLGPRILRAETAAIAAMALWQAACGDWG